MGNIIFDMFFRLFFEGLFEFLFNKYPKLSWRLWCAFSYYLVSISLPSLI